MEIRQRSFSSRRWRRVVRRRQVDCRFRQDRSQQRRASESLNQARIDHKRKLDAYIHILGPATIMNVNVSSCRFPRCSDYDRYNHRNGRPDAGTER